MYAAQGYAGVENSGGEAMIRLVIPGDVVPQGRPRFARIGTYVHTYDPRKSSDYKDRVKVFAKKLRLAKPLEGPLLVKIAIYRQIPASWSAKKREQAMRGEILPVTRPDNSNLCKGIEDSCNGILWNDDSQITDLIVIKRYSDDPRAVIEIEEVPR